MDAICRFGVEATLVANEFIDRYMADANGEYVKVYLYLLRHSQEKPDVGQIADALNHTEADVRRALSYWEKMGALTLSSPERSVAENQGAIWRDSDSRRSPSQSGVSGQTGGRAASDQSGAAPAGNGASGQAGAETAAASGRPVYSQDQVNRLQGDGEFSQLLYIAQRYLNKIFTQRELEVFAYLYDGLHMSAELLEYLVEYCVQGGHTSIRYIETVALNWHKKELRTVEQAKAYASGFTKDSFSVMRAFGLTDRKPGDAEKEMIERWFGTYGFTRELVLEACNRTMEATHNPSFRYADKILSEWNKAGVKNLRDVSELDEKRKSQKRRGGAGGRGETARPQTNQFHNFEQRDTDYDSMVLEQVRGWIGES